MPFLPFFFAMIPSLLFSQADAAKLAGPRAVAVKPERPKTLPPAQLLASIDAGKRLEIKDSAVISMAKKLDQAKTVFKNDEVTIANLIVDSHKELKEKGKPTRCIYILEDFIEIKNSLSEHDDLSTVYAMYLTYRIEVNASRKETIQNVKALHRLLNGEYPSQPDPKKPSRRPK
jgi:hypothetical protein